nr:MAG TPA: hypothetical protein [Caudoviricetes sp.]
MEINPSFFMSRNITSKIKRYNLIFYDTNTAKSVLFSSIFVCKIVYGFCKLLIINTNCGAGGSIYLYIYINHTLSKVR